jgi:hypothetical protein
MSPLCYLNEYILLSAASKANIEKEDDYFSFALGFNPKLKKKLQ